MRIFFGRCGHRPLQNINSKKIVWTTLAAVRINRRNAEDGVPYRKAIYINNFAYIINGGRTQFSQCFCHCFYFETQLPYISVFLPSLDDKVPQNDNIKQKIACRSDKTGKRLFFKRLFQEIKASDDCGFFGLTLANLEKADNFDNRQHNEHYCSCNGNDESPAKYRR